MQALTNLRARTLVAASSLLVGFAFVHGQAHAQDSTGTRAVPTYEAVGLYWSNPGANSATGCQVKYRVSGSSSWSQGLDMWFDASNSECRGSVVGLTPGTPYEVAFNLPGVSTSPKGLTFTTWSNTVPVAQTINVPSGSATLTISAGGSASGYIVYDGTGSTLDAQNGAATNINVNASYVIVRGFTLQGAQQHGILIDKNQHDVIIEDNDISGWGRTRDGTWGTDMDSGIRSICVNEELTRVTVQRNKIHDPRYAANSWAVAHPAGPQGVTFSYCGGNNVYRWNEIYSAKNHFNDAMGGEDNFSTNGWPNKDSDIYGNRVEMTWDDGIEAEGGNANVRIWGNYINNTGTGVASTIDSVGPMYIFRNVWNRNQFIEGASCDSDQKQPMFKSGSSSDFGNGRRYLFHNTMLQAQASGCTNGLGGGRGRRRHGRHAARAQHGVDEQHLPDLEERRLVLPDRKRQHVPERSHQRGLLPEVGGLVGLPKYASGSGWQSESGGMYQLAAGSPGFDQGMRINNFNDRFNGAAPDVGAAEAGDGAMKFGVAAASAATQRRRHGHRRSGSDAHTDSHSHADADSHADSDTGHRWDHDRQQSRRPQRRSQDARARRRLEHARAGRNGRHHRLGRRLDHDGLVELHHRGGRQRDLHRARRRQRGRARRLDELPRVGLDHRRLRRRRGRQRPGDVHDVVARRGHLGDHRRSTRAMRPTAPGRRDRSRRP